MPLTIIDFPSAPECEGKQISIHNEDELAELVARVLIGQSHHVARILAGAQKRTVVTSEAQKAQLRAMLFPTAEPRVFHRDGLLFEIICWMVARITATPNEVISAPHLHSTQQGVDTIRISFDPATRNVHQATICEQKCTVNARQQFRDHVLPAFRAWLNGERDAQLLSEAMALLERFDLSDDEQLSIYGRLIQERPRPLAFHAALTVTPELYETEQCVALFRGFSALAEDPLARNGDTFPLAQIRPWFQDFAQRVWVKIEAINV
jgi:hypothetical protein